MKLYTTQAQYERLVEKANGRGNNASVSRKDLFYLVADHSRLCARLQELNEFVEPGKPEED